MDTNRLQRDADRLYLILAAIFIAALVACNLTFQKFFTWDFLGLHTFEISVGILPYPVTFLVTDILSEIYGRKRANQVVVAGLGASIFTTLVVLVSSAVEATPWSPVDNETFDRVFGLTALAVGSSMTAYLLAQFIDIRIYHFWKRLTGGRHLWLRNNGSTIFSQFVDTLTILLLLCSFEVISWNRFGELLWSGFLFKVLMALFDTPLFYLAVHLLQKHFGLRRGEELPERI